MMAKRIWLLIPGLGLLLLALATSCDTGGATPAPPNATPTVGNTGGATAPPTATPPWATRISTTFTDLPGGGLQGVAEFQHLPPTPSLSPSTALPILQMVVTGTNPSAVRTYLDTDLQARFAITQTSGPGGTSTPPIINPTPAAPLLRVVGADIRHAGQGNDPSSPDIPLKDPKVPLVVPYELGFNFITIRVAGAPVQTGPISQMTFWVDGPQGRLAANVDGPSGSPEPPYTSTIYWPLIQRDRLPPGDYRVTLAGTEPLTHSVTPLRAENGTLLDGDPLDLPSGDGQEGGDFVFFITILPPATSPFSDMPTRPIDEVRFAGNDSTKLMHSSKNLHAPLIVNYGGDFMFNFTRREDRPPPLLAHRLSAHGPLAQATPLSDDLDILIDILGVHPPYAVEYEIDPKIAKNAKHNYKFAKPSSGSYTLKAHKGNLTGTVYNSSNGLLQTGTVDANTGPITQPLPYGDAARCFRSKGNSGSTGDTSSNRYSIWNGATVKVGEWAVSWGQSCGP